LKAKFQNQDMIAQHNVIKMAYVHETIKFFSRTSKNRILNMIEHG